MAAHLSNLDRMYGVTNIKSHIPIILDTEDHNYDAWRELFLTHCQSFDVAGHLDGTLLPTDATAAAWTKHDGIVKLWLYGTLSKNLFKSTFKTGGTSQDIWTRIENYFRNNKEARAIRLDHSLRNTQIGDLTINAYCQELKSIADRLANVSTPVPDRTLVTYFLNGLNEKYDNIINVVMHRQPFPTFEEARSMLLLEEERLNRGKKPSAVVTTNDTSSSDKVLLASSSSQDQKTSSTNNQPQQRFYNNRGRGRHNRGRGRSNFYNQRPRFQPWNVPFWTGNYPMWNQQQQQPWPQMQQQQYAQQGLLGSRPNQQFPQQTQQLGPQPTADFASAFNTMTLVDPSNSQWYMDTGATTHLANSAGSLNSVFNLTTGKSVMVANGNRIPIHKAGSVSFPTKSRPLSLNTVLVTPSIIKNLISVRKFTTDNVCSIEFDPFGFSVKDLITRRTIFRSDSTGDLYPVFPFSNNSSQDHSSFLATSSSIWHQRLAHPNNISLNSLFSSSVLACNKHDLQTLCNACQLGKQNKLPFSHSDSAVSAPFDIIHSDIWTSPVSSLSGIKYYVLFLDQFTHYLWVYPLRRKSEVFSKFLHFSALVKNQFSATIKSLQCDNGGEFNNHQFHKHFADHGISFRFSCPYTSQQNGRSERMIQTINNAVRTLLFQAKLPSSFWVEALHTAVYLLNILPSKAIQNHTPYTILFKKLPDYNHLKVFGCLCYPNQNNSITHKLSPRSSRCLFLGYPSDYRGYRCYDLNTRKIILSRHVRFDETCFPYPNTTPQDKSTYDFLDQDSGPSALCRQILTNSLQPAPTLPVQQPTSQAPTQASQAAAEAPRHAMTTRSKHGIRKTKQVLSLHTTTVPPLPKNHRQALADPFWNPAINDEYSAIIKSKTYDLVPRPPNANIINSLWLYKHKYDANGVYKKPKARLVADGKTQEHGIDFTETFSPVVKPATIRTLLQIALVHDWPVNQLDVQNAFLHGNLEETVYMFQPPGFVDKTKPHHVCKLNRSIYGLKQAPRAWNARFVSFITKQGFKQSKNDTSLFVYARNGMRAYLILYVDDIVITASTTQLRNSVIAALKKEFPITDEGQISSFLGISAKFNDKGLFLNQSHYAEEILERAGMQDCKPCTTPVDLKSKLDDKEGAPVKDPKEYRSLAGALQYLTFTRPDISYAVQQVCLFMHDPREPHLLALKRVLRYVQGTKHLGLQLLKHQKMKMTAYSDADWAGCPSTRRSTSGYCIYLGDNLITWSAKRQPTVSRSSAEAEYKGVANCVAEACWLRNLLLEMDFHIPQATIVYCDNISAVYLSSNPVQHQRTKHIEIDIHFVREKVQMGQVRVLHIPSELQYADIFTKGLPSSLFNSFRTSLGVT